MPLVVSTIPQRAYMIHRVHHPLSRASDAFVYPIYA